MRTIRIPTIILTINNNKFGARSGEVVSEIDEIRGLALKSDIGSAEALQHLMVSVLCLHHHLHELRNDMDFDSWKTLQGSTLPNSDQIPGDLLYKIWRVVRKEPIPQLEVPGLTGLPPEEEVQKTMPEEVPWLLGLPSMQGWVNVNTPGHAVGDPTGRLWASACLGLLFFSLSPGAAAPEAFMSLSGVFPSWDGSCIVLEKWRNFDGKNAESSPPAGSLVTVALLKPDGSWKECSFQKIELGIPSTGNPQSWLKYLGAMENTRSWV